MVLDNNDDYDNNDKHYDIKGLCICILYLYGYPLLVRIDDALHSQIATGVFGIKALESSFMLVLVCNWGFFYLIEVILSVVMELDEFLF